MTEAEWRDFLLAGSRTGKLATVRPDGRPHVAPVWFTLDEDDLVFMTMADTVKGRNLRADPRAAISVDEEQFPFAFVLIEGSARVETPSPDELVPFATRIARRYVGDDRAESYGRRNATEGEMLVRVRLDRVIARKGVAS
ncbi:MAG: PPOX class F420-dependent oxidoreductase [Myxococcales bacterium]|nr:PPOX class F420-dependent oxidoreductase [Myxococcales bacterium]